MGTCGATTDFSNMTDQNHSPRHRPPRLSIIHQTPFPPLYYITFCTHRKRHILANQEVHNAFQEYSNKARLEHGVAVGRYVIMPDHIHLFVRGHYGFRLSYWIRGLRRAISDVLKTAGQTDTVWQEGFFDHALRSSESYSKKWDYVWKNPVRKGLVKEPDDWPYSGEIVRIDRA